MAELSASTWDAIREGTIRSANAIAPFIGELLADWPMATILDVGAGEAHWADALHELTGAVAILNLDVAPRAATERWREVVAWDAEAVEPLPRCTEFADPAGRWDIALCLEMAEHVTPSAGERLVRDLTRVASQVVWSAAIPGQGGDGHVNEQPPGYWAERFARFGWKLTDPFRGHLWADPRVEPWYAQNLLLASPVALGDSWRAPRHLVHPAIFAGARENAAVWRQTYLDHLNGVA